MYEGAITPKERSWLLSQITQLLNIESDDFRCFPLCAKCYEKRIVLPAAKRAFENEDRPDINGFFIA